MNPLEMEIFKGFVAVNAFNFRGFKLTAKKPVPPLLTARGVRDVFKFAALLRQMA